MLLLRGATTGVTSMISSCVCFNTCSSCEEQQSGGNRTVQMLVSIHAPLARSNSSAIAVAVGVPVSIHAPLARSNRAVEKQKLALQFQYMLLLRGATRKRRKTMSITTFQYMLLLRGATAHPSFPSPEKDGFNTCSSCEEQLHRTVVHHVFRVVSIHAPLARSNRTLTIHVHSLLFQYMLLLRGATTASAVLATFDRVSIHAPLARSNR